jgi:hypothetical protein
LSKIDFKVSPLNTAVLLTPPTLVKIMSSLSDTAAANVGVNARVVVAVDGFADASPVIEGVLDSVYVFLKLAELLLLVII